MDELRFHCSNGLKWTQRQHGRILAFDPGHR